MAIIADENRYPPLDAETYRRMISFAFSDVVEMHGEVLEKERARHLHLTIPPSYIVLYKGLFQHLMFISLTPNGIFKQSVVIEPKK